MITVSGIGPKLGITVLSGLPVADLVSAIRSGNLPVLTRVDDIRRLSRAEAGRYHLYVARACPWAHRTTIFRELKGLQDHIGLSVTHWLMAEDGWTFDHAPGVIGDPVNGTDAVWQLYAKSESGYTGRVTVPVLWDRRRNTIVNNESLDIIKMLDRAFDAAPGTLEL